MAKFNIGDVITFRYSKNNASDKNPTILVVSPLFKGYVHGINLNYLNDSSRKILLEGIDKSNKVSSEIFYEQHIKTRLSVNAYRTYTPRLMTNIKVTKTNK